MPIQVCDVGPTEPHPESIPPPLHLALGSGVYSHILFVVAWTSIWSRLLFGKLLNCWTIPSVTSLAGRAGLWSPLSSLSSWSASSLGEGQVPNILITFPLSDGRRSRSPYQGTLLYGGCLVPPSCWSTLSSSSTCSSPTMCRSLRRSTSGLGHPWVAQQVQATNSITYNDSFAYFRNPSEAQRSSWCGSSRFWGRWWGGRSSRASGQRSRRAGGQRGEEGQVKFKFWENGTIILFLGQVSQRFPDKSASTILKQNLCFILVEGRWKHFLEEKLLTRTSNVNSYIWDIHLWKGCNCKCNTICPWSFCCASLSQINKLCSKQATVLSPEVTLKISSKST